MNPDWAQLDFQQQRPVNWQLGSAGNDACLIGSARDRSSIRAPALLAMPIGDDIGRELHQMTTLGYATLSFELHSACSNGNGQENQLIGTHEQRI